MDYLQDEAALARLAPSAIEALTDAATQATFYDASLNEAQIAANRRVVAISKACCETAAASPNQSFIAAFDQARCVGYVIATRHSADNLELDWLMTHPDYHGTPVSSELMQRGMGWLGASNPIWLNVIAYNKRAIRFYEKFGFAIDPVARTNHAVPHVIMRRQQGTP